MSNKRRMFSDQVTNTDVFLDMPKGSQLLYFHLGIEADDDGFIASPKKIMRVIGSSEDEWKVLLAKKFVVAFPSGVAAIKHWRINNYIRKDIYQETKYTKEKSTLYIRDNGAYTFTKEGAKQVPKGHFVLSDSTSTERARVVNIGKVREGKIRLGENVSNETVGKGMQKIGETMKKLKIKKNG